MGLFDSSIDRRLGNNNQLIKLALLIDWNPIRIILEKVHKRDELTRSGGFSYNKLKMFKAVLLGQWHSLSDAKLEEALNVRLDFMKFCGFELDEAPVSGGGSDANFTSAVGCPSIDGLGAEGDGAHTLREHVFVSALPRRLAFWRNTLKNIE